MGIFKKGKSSSPVKSRQGGTSFGINQRVPATRLIPCLVSGVFSEVKFLSRHPFSNPERLPIAQLGSTEGPEKQSIADAYERPLTNHESHNILTENEGEVPSNCTVVNDLNGKAQIEAMPEESFEMYTKRLLHFDLRSWETSEIMSKVDSTRKYWNLEDLKALLEQRIESWHLNQEQQKRERSSFTESMVTTLHQGSKVEPQSRDDQTQVFQDFEPRHESVALNIPGILHETNEDVSENFELEDACWSPSYNEEHHDSMLLGQKVTESINLANLNNDALSKIYTGDSCEDYATEMDWAYDEPLALDGNEKDLGMYQCETLAFHALDAAYDMIIDSDKGSMYEAFDDGKMKLSDDSLMDDNETTNLIQQGYQTWGISEAENSLLPSSIKYKETARPSGGDEEQVQGETPYTCNRPEMRYCGKQFPAWQQERTGQQATNALGPEEEFLRGLKGFWRQHKLY